MKYLAQPQYENQDQTSTVAIYEFPLTANPAILLGPFPDSPNGALVYQDGSGVKPALYLFVAFFSSNGNGYVNVYDLDAIMAAGMATQLPTALKQLTLTPGSKGDSVQPIGMAIQPGTSNLLVATIDNNFSNGTVSSFGWNQGSAGMPDVWGPTSTVLVPFSSPAMAGVASNLAFDRHGNLWLTTFDADGSYLSCFTVASNYQTTLTLVNGPAAQSSSLLPCTLLAGTVLATQLNPKPPANAPSLFPLSAPEGIAFDPAGNLWLSNNNGYPASAGFSGFDVNATPAGSLDGSGGGSLLMISGAWLDSLLYPTLTTEAAGLAITTSTKFMGTAPVMAYYLNDDANFGGLCFDGYTLYINDENNYDDEGISVVWQCDTRPVVDPNYPGYPDVAALKSSFALSGVNTTNPGNGSMSIFNSPYEPKTLTIRDIVSDDGTQPDSAASGDMWESPDILVSENSTLPGIALNVPMAQAATVAFTAGTVATGDPAYIYVKVTNFGTTDGAGTEILTVYYAFASTGLSWPGPWDGANLTALPLGDVIGETLMCDSNGNGIPAGQQMYFQIPWPVSKIPDPKNYTGLLPAGLSQADIVTQSGHFCLLARIQSTSVYPFGMAYPEGVATLTDSSALHANTVNNSFIGWRNIEIMDESNGEQFGPDFIRLHVFGANHELNGQLVSFGIQTLSQAGRVEVIKAKVVIQAEGAALERIRATRFEEHRFRSLGEGRFELLDREAGMERIHLPAQTLLPFTVEFKPEEGLRDFAVRVIQYLTVNGVKKVVGGQTFVIGKVHGFPQREKRIER